MLLPGQLPPSVEKVGLNAIGGVLFLVAAVRFAVLYREIRGWDEFWFAIHAALFGSAGVLFAGSELWDPAWWWCIS
jgi:hypothetical protein